MLRIAVNTRLLLPGTLEGIGYYTRELCRRLPELMPEATFLFCFDRPFDPGLTAHPRVTGRVIFPPTRDPLLWRAWFDYRIPRVLRKWNADLFFSPDGYCSLRTGVPQVMVTHDIAFAHYRDHLPARVQRYYERHVPLFLEAARRVITVSEFVRQDVHRRYATPLDKLSVAGNGVKPLFRPLPHGEVAAVRDRYAAGRPYLFYLGAVHPRKNIDGLIEAYSRYRAATTEGVPLLLGGRFAWQNASVRAACERSAYREDIRFLGYLPEAALAQVLGGAAAMIYPSLSEGFGVPLLEAMHAEVPILTSRCTSLPEVAGPAALYFDPLRPDDMAAAISRILTEAPLRDRLVAEGRLRRQRYTWQRTAREVAATLRSVEIA